MKTEQEIKETIAKLNAAIDADGFIPTPSGAKLQEHLYYRRIAAVEYLTWVIESEEERQIQEELALRQAEPCA